MAGRGDRQWVYMSLAEAYQGLGRTADEQRLVRKIEAEATEFGMSSYMEQKAKLAAAMTGFEGRVRPDALRTETAVRDAPQGQAAGEAKSEQPSVTTQRFRPSVSSGANPITIDADIMRGKAVKSIEVTCKIEYS